MKRLAFKKKAAIEFQIGDIKISKENILPETIHTYATSEILTNKEIFEALNKDLGIKEEDLAFYDETEADSPIGLDIIFFEEDILEALKDPAKLANIIEQLQEYKKTLEFYQNFNNPYIKIRVSFD